MVSTTARTSAIAPSRAKQIVKHWLCLLSLWLALPALAADILRIPADGQFDLPIGEQLDLLVDPQRSYTLSQVQHSRDFRLVRTNDLTLDFNRGRYWLRFGLSNSSTQERNAVLRIRPSHLDHLRLFTLDGREIQPVNTRGIARSPNLFSLSIAPQQQVLFYLCIDGVGLTPTSLSLTDLYPFLIEYRYELFGNGIGIGLLFALGIANFAVFFVYPRIRLFVLLGCYSLCNMSAIAASWGYILLSEHASSLFSNPAFVVLTHLSMAIAILIANEFQLRTAEPQLRWRRLMQVLVAINLMAAAVATQLAVSYSSIAMVALVGISATLITLRPLLTYFQSQDRAAFEYLLSRAWLVLFVTVISLTYTHLSASTETINMLMLFGTATEVLILSLLALIDRQRSLVEGFKHRLRVSTLEAEVRSGNETLRRFNHGLITPLSAIFGIAEMLRNSRLSPQQRDYVQSLLAASQDMLGIVENIQSQDFLDNETPTTPELLFDLPPLLQDFADSHIGELTALSLDDDMPGQVLGDPGRLRQLLSQLLLVTTYFATEPGIRLSARWHEKLYLDFSYRGRKALLLLHLGDTASESREALQTRGEIVSQLVQALGGSLRLQSLGPNQHIHVVVPLTQWEHEQKLPQLLQLKARRILIVEANRHFALQQKKHCEQWGMIAFVAHNDRQAIALLRNQCTLRAPIHVQLISDSSPDPVRVSNRLRHEAELAQLPPPGTIFLLENGRDVPADATGPYRQMSKPSASFTLKRLIIEILEEQSAQTEQIG